MRALDRLDPAKRDYLMRVARLLMEDSYLARETAASMPPHVKEHLAASRERGRYVNAASAVSIDESRTAQRAVA